jgi:prevent-host-death family protein
MVTRVPTTLNVAEAKRRLSELMSRVAYRGERFLIRRRNVPMVALVPAGDLSKIEQESSAGRGLLAAVGAWAKADDLDETVKEIYRQRRRAKDRRVRMKS